MEPELLSEDIFRFLDAHAKSRADYDPEFDRPEERFNGPDSRMLFSAAKALSMGQTPMPVQSSWESGCYKPMNDAAGRAWHDAILSSLRLLRENKSAGFQRLEADN